MTLDDVRQRFPMFGFAVYAYEPGGPVTLEVLMPDGHTTSWTAPTVPEAIAQSFLVVPAEEPAETPEDDIFS